MCDHCDYRQALTNLNMLLASDLHILDQAKLERLKRYITSNLHVTPGQKREIVDIEAEERGETE